MQEIAIANTRERLSRAGLVGRCQLILDGHQNLNQYVEKESVDGIVFNFGYLPGGDHSISTKKSTSIEAIQKGMEALKPGGIMSMCIYSGQDTGFEEKNSILDYLKTVDQRKYVIIMSEFYNRPNNPPIPVFIINKCCHDSPEFGAELKPLSPLAAKHGAIGRKLSTPNFSPIRELKQD